jgi:hypothetical protein
MISICRIVTFFLSLLIFHYTESQQLITEKNRIRVVFYNVENLFDTFNDSLTDDEEFLPESIRHWNNNKFYRKLNNISKVIVGIGEWNPPAIVGFCEIENRFVLHQLVSSTPLATFDYRIIHQDSPDRRGIDAGLIYLPDIFSPLIEKFFPLEYNSDKDFRTRDILYVKGIVSGIDTLHLFINHWPSRYGGFMATQDKRNSAASMLRIIIDSLQGFGNNPKIMIMGDFNDNPDDESIKMILGAEYGHDFTDGDDLVNLMYPYQKIWDQGSLKFQQNWDIFDQIIVTGNLLQHKNGLSISESRAWIFNVEYLLTDDEIYLGKKPFRTFNGYDYQGGYSDHLPVYTDLIMISPNNK